MSENSTTATQPGPRTWAPLTSPPGVEKVRTLHGVVWIRVGDQWTQESGQDRSRMSWAWILDRYGPLTEVPAEAPAPTDAGPWPTFDKVPDGVIVAARSGHLYQRDGIQVTHLRRKDLSVCCVGALGLFHFRGPFARLGVPL
ncbi:hypothetical protein C8K38_111222 [Rhodococcus sp. OK611]|uniref:hypothetical protein n=1 Tax=unclassified Rhodococcus (in: high G+C Gram-positive bacteria) TaxID=192944 RepID=UPI000BD20A0B|nr:MULTISPECIES: hypothetical protein [unclassified Rhodococcus (in: high G+C Gram-positive bacteria)]PTR42053.1 hypothetical protein C8K38_111222 [Rhodococcus sp. OK611]SNX91500.1 hypothetical protein SAMN05447004_11035 [Rhodococcus sp. OK270]